MGSPAASSKYRATGDYALLARRRQCRRRLRLGHGHRLYLVDPCPQLALRGWVGPQCVCASAGRSTVRVRQCGWRRAARLHCDMVQCVCAGRVGATPLARHATEHPPTPPAP